MRRHEISVFSLLAAVAFGAVAIALIATDGHFTSYDINWSLIGALAGGALGAALIAAASLSILRERRSDEAAAPFADE